MTILLRRKINKLDINNDYILKLDKRHLTKNETWW